ncbi:hypothetical protein HXX76_006021 [Chlamydomonas incerta]|uniref:MYND-type domain-containing protein n=1 Tax=Chlamydomonas incerta TaxID=51695 RepID=A0A835W6E6_CHLIN|nr:hypothetical protein HXX76_006021 [Chlamydomonas incerta]|eukprot:KAG2437366.1 hypothetical protein HXX76_006021 [Chlamydomonas incerta]
MAAISVDPPHMTCTGAACSTCSNVAPGKLLRCSACHSAWYCDQDCQRKGFKEHKPFCKALRLFHALQADLPPESWPRTAHDFYIQRINCQQLLEPMLGRPLSRAEHRALLGEAKCSVCIRTRAQLARKSGAPTAPTAPPGATATAATAAAGATAVSGSTRGTSSAAAGAAGQSDGGGGGGGGGKDAGGKASEPAVPVAVGAKDAAAAPAPTPAPAAAAAAASPAGASPAGGLTCCPHCNWGWVCGEHRDAYLSGPHAVVCLPYRHMNESQQLTQRYLTATGRVPNYVPDAPRRPTVLPPEAAKAVAAAAAAKGAGGGGSAGASAGGSGSGSGGSGGSGGGWEPVPAGGWAAFQGWRPLPVFDQALMCLLTKRVSQALTVIQALQHHYSPQQLAARSSFEIHVLGASAFEVPADRIWEELLNLLPPFDPAAAAAAAIEALSTDDDGGAAGRDASATAGGGGSSSVSRKAGAAGGAAYTKEAAPRRLHVAFVGPELCDIILDESDGRAMPQGTSLSTPPPPPGRELLYSYHLCTYQEYAAGRTPRSEAPGAPPPPPGSAPAPWRRPDLAVAFNSGISESEQKLWAPALQLLARQGVPVVFTSYNAHEAEGDAAAWRAAGGVVTLGPERNPYRALEPIAEPSQVDVFYYQNYYWWCGRTKSDG